jgi:error-prone DNA polymerase
MPPVSLPAYAELHCRSNFSFLTGASQPEELVQRAQALGYAALALTDECSLSGAVRAHTEAERLQFRLIVGAEMRLSLPGASSPLVANTESYESALIADDEADFDEAADVADAVAVAVHSQSDPAQADQATQRQPSIKPSLAPPIQVPAPLPATGPSRAAAKKLRQNPLVKDDRVDATTEPLTEPRLLLLAQSRRGYANLSQWITVARRRAPKGQYRAWRSDLEGRVPTCPTLAGLPGCMALLLPDASQSFETVFAHAMWLKTWFGVERAALGVSLRHRAHDAALLAVVLRVAAATGLQLVATGGVCMHARSRKALLDVLTATRLKSTVASAGFALHANAEAHLRSRVRLARLYQPAWLAATVHIAGQCAFSLAELRYEYPREITPTGHTPTSWLLHLVQQGALQRFPASQGGVPAPVQAMLNHEIALITQLRYEPYFLTVADIVHWARSQGILCQGRGSAANSAVCYCLGVTAVDPARTTLLFERFISAERNEPPDIDIDFEHQRREEVIQYIYRKYGRHRAALTGVMITYRPRSALRDVGRALGVDADRINAVAKGQQWWDGKTISADRLAENGFDPQSPLCLLWMELTASLIGFPRHLSQHPGGFVIARDDLAQLVPVENAAMADRSVIQWDKDDLDALGLLKVDILALGMLSAIRRALVMVGDKLGQPMALHQVPAEDAASYAMLCKGDSVGTFQVESRAQMSMLPRLQPRCFYDLVIEVAIVRPGPIQGGMVHPYLKRRSGEEPVDYPSDEVRQALARTLGVPIFQEQVMQLAILAADFTPGEADQLRRAMAAWKRKGGLGPFHERLVGRMVQKGYTLDYAERIFKQIQGFGEYGFPESHAASFALLVYVSAWIKCHHPDAFLAALLNSQPMGFYAPAQLVRDAREHGVQVLPVDVNHSVWDSVLQLQPHADPSSPDKANQTTDCTTDCTVDCTTDDTSGTNPTPLLQPVRLGFNRISGLPQDAAQRVVAARAQAPFTGPEDLARRAALNAQQLALLAQADALLPLAGHRHQAAWAVAGVDTRVTPLLRATRTQESAAQLALPTAATTVLADYRAMGLSLQQHPVALLRAQLQAFKVQPAAVLRHYPTGRLARASGLVTHRQRPETAKGVVFVTLEDDTGSINVIVWPQVADQQRRPLLASSLLTVYGIWQCEGEVRHLVAKRLIDHSVLLQGLVQSSRNFR